MWVTVTVSNNRRWLHQFARGKPTEDVRIGGLSQPPDTRSRRPTPKLGLETPDSYRIMGVARMQVGKSGAVRRVSWSVSPAHRIYLELLSVCYRLLWQRRLGEGCC